MIDAFRDGFFLFKPPSPFLDKRQGSDGGRFPLQGLAHSRGGRGTNSPPERVLRAASGAPFSESRAWAGGAVAPTPHCLRVLSFGFRQPFKFFILFLKLNFKEQRLKHTSFKKGPVGLSLQSDRRSNRGRPSPAPPRARRWLPAGPGLCAAPPGGPQSFPGALGFHPSTSGKKLTHVKTMIFKSLWIMRNVTTGRMSYRCRGRNRVEALPLPGSWI